MRPQQEKRHLRRRAEDIIRTDRGEKTTYESLRKEIKQLFDLLMNEMLPESYSATVTNGATEHPGQSGLDESHTHATSEEILSHPYTKLRLKVNTLLAQHEIALEELRSTEDLLHGLPTIDPIAKKDRRRTPRETLQERFHALRRGIIMSNLDGLTRLGNRQLLEYKIKKYFEKHGLRSLASLAMVDLDDFKMVNDTFGHQTGDKLLSLVAKTIQSVILSKDLNDSAFRIGGDEFVIFFANVTPDEAEELVKRIEHRIHKLFIQRGWRQGSIDKTGYNQEIPHAGVSIGLVHKSSIDDDETGEFSLDIWLEQAEELATVKKQIIKQKYGVLSRKAREALAERVQQHNTDFSEEDMEKAQQIAREMKGTHLKK